MTSPNRCFHCDAAVPALHSFLLEVNGLNRCFCSEKCWALAKRINQAGLSDFYRFREAPTSSASARETEPGRWAGYDRPALQREFVAAQPSPTGPAAPSCWCRACAVPPARG